MKVKSEFIGYPNANLSRRFGAYVLDILIALVVGIIFTVVSSNILPNVPAYKSAVTDGNQALTNCYQIIEDSHLRKTIKSSSSTTLVELSTTFKEYITHHIDGDNDTSNDNIEYYYLTYRKDNNLGEIGEYDQKYINVTVRGLNEDPSKNTSIIWTYADINEIPKLTDNYKTLLKEYFDGATSSEHQTAYNNAYNEYEEIINNKALVELTTSSKSPYDAQFRIYEVNIRSYYQIWAVDILICYLAAIIISYIPFAFIFKDANSAGKKALKLTVLDNNEYRTSWYKKLLRILCILIQNLYMCVIMILFIDSNVLAVPIFYIGSVAISPTFFIVISLVLSIVSLGFVIFRKDKKSLHDLILKTSVVDIRVLPSDINATPNDTIDQYDIKAMEANKKKSVNADVIDNPIDSKDEK